ncbi:MAG: MFS transporter [Dehalococcoidales bacterium]|nr:MFS transporter [Dehalococcoidales bacterium]
MRRETGHEVSKGAALLVACMAGFLTPFMVSSISVALPAISKDFNLNAVILAWIPTAYLLAAAIFLVPFGRIADIHGRKKVFLYGMILYTISCFLLPFSKSEAMLLVFRVLEGIGSAAIFSTGTAILISVFPPGERGKALGINVAAVYAGLSLGPAIGGFLTEHFTWRSIFFINGPLGLVVVALVLTKLRGEWTEAKGEKLDVIGSIIYGLGLAALIIGFSMFPKANGVWLLAAGVAGLLLFIFLETRIKHPVLNLRLFRHNTVFTMSNVAALINYSATAGVVFLLSLYLQYIKGFTAERAGLVLLVQPLVMSALSPLAGRMSDRMEPRVVATAGMALTTAGLVPLIFLNRDSGVWYIVMCLLLLGLGFGLFSSPNTNAVMSSVERKFYGVASATLATMRLVGQMLSLATVMLLFSVIIGKVQITPEYYDAFLTSSRVGFTVFAALCFVGIFASVARGKVKRQ